MVQQVRSITLRIGGQVADSLRQATDETEDKLGGLQAVQRREQATLRSLRAQRRLADRSTENGARTYERLTGEINQLNASVSERAVSIEDLRQRESRLNRQTNRQSAIARRQVTRGVVGLVAMAGAYAALSLGISRTNDDIRQWTITAARGNRELGDLREQARSLSVVFGSGDFGSQAIQQAEDFRLRLERSLTLGSSEVDFSRLAIAGIDLQSLREIEDGQALIEELAARRAALQTDAERVRFDYGLEATGVGDAVVAFSQLNSEVRDIQRQRAIELGDLRGQSRGIGAASSEIAALTDNLQLLATGGLALVAPPIQYIAGALNTVLMPLVMFATWLSDVSNSSDNARRVIGVLGGIVFGLVGIFFAANVAMGVWSIGMGTAQVAAGLLRGSVLGLNAALLANPFVLIAAAVAAVTVGLVYFFTQTETGRRLWAQFTGFVTRSAQDIIGWIKQFGPNILLMLGPIGLLIRGVIYVAQNFDKLRSRAESARDSIGAFFSPLIDGAREAWRYISLLIDGWNRLRGFLGRATFGLLGGDDDGASAPGSAPADGAPVEVVVQSGAPSAAPDAPAPRFPPPRGPDAPGSAPADGAPVEVVVQSGPPSAAPDAPAPRFPPPPPTTPTEAAPNIVVAQSAPQPDLETPRQNAGRRIAYESSVVHNTTNERTDIDNRTTRRVTVNAPVTINEATDAGLVARRVTRDISRELAKAGGPA